MTPPDPLSTPPGPALQLRGVAKRYDGPAAPWSLQDIDLDLAAGQAVALVGASGSGKSTLLNLLCGIDRPTQGQIRVAGTLLGDLDETALTRWRGLQVGLVFQSHHLLPTLTVLDNVMLPMELCGRWPSAERPSRALALLARLGIAEQAHKLPADLSGGQQQRAALARALANDAPLIVADEPTGQLDSANSARVLGLLAGLAAEGRTVVVATHERDPGPGFSRVIRLADGRLA